MHPLDPESGAGAGRFAETRWSVVLGTQAADEAERKRALEWICGTYWKPVYVFLRQRSSSPEDAADLTQSVFSRLLAEDWLAEVKRENGRLRSFLCTAAARHAITEYQKGQAQKRGGGNIHVPFDAVEAEEAFRTLSCDGATPDAAFERQWVVDLVRRVMDRLRVEMAKSGRLELFEALIGYLAGGSDEEAIPEIADRLGMTKGAVTMILKRLRDKYRKIFSAEVRATVQSPDDVPAEYTFLLRSAAG